MQFQSKYWYPKNAPKTIQQYDRDCIADPRLALCKFSEDRNGAVTSVIINNGVGTLNQQELIAKIASLPKLEKFIWVTLYGCGGLSIEGLKIILESATIKDVFLMGHDRIAHQRFEICNTCLNKLLLNGCSLGEELLDSLGTFRELTTLRLVDLELCYLDPAKINKIPKLTHLILDSTIAAHFNRTKMRTGINLHVTNGPEQNDHLGCI